MSGEVVEEDDELNFPWVVLISLFIFVLALTALGFLSLFGLGVTYVIFGSGPMFDKVGAFLLSSIYLRIMLGISMLAMAVIFIMGAIHLLSNGDNADKDDDEY